MSNLKQLIKLSGQHHKKFVLFFIDLDHFKSANDHYGHHAGDHILKIVAERLKNYFHKDDIIARLGGDEFAILIENISNREKIETMAEQIGKMIALPIEMNNITLQVNASIGISIYPYDGHDEDALLQCADKNMYHVKNNGGDNFYFSSKKVPGASRIQT